MSRNRNQTLLILGALAQGSWLGELLGYPESSALDLEFGNLEARLQSISAWLLEQTPPRFVHRRSLIGARVKANQVRVERIEVKIPAPSEETGWREPITVSLGLITIDRAGAGVLGYLPELGLAASAVDSSQLKVELGRDGLLALLGRGHATSLASLLRLPLFDRLETRIVEIGGGLPGAAPEAGDGTDSTALSSSTLALVSDDLCALDLSPGHRMEEQAGRLASLLGGLPPRSALLVGSRGCGKTTTIHELVRRRRELGMHETPFFSTTGSRLLAGMSGFGMWQERCRQLCREAAQRRAVVSLGNLLELSELGRHESNAQSLASFLRPAIARGELLAIAECTPEELAVLESRDPQLARAFDILELRSPDVDLLDGILRDEADQLNQRTGVVFDQDALIEIRRLHLRYSPCSGVPSRPIMFLRRLAEETAAGIVLRAGHVDAAFARESGLPLAILSEGEVLDLNSARAWFESRVLGQTDAVDQVVDVLAAIKARLTRPDRPIANLLFAGPTGVGKTEMARSLAAYLFGDDSRLLRLDMSEYSDPYSVTRLHTGTGERGGILTSRLREQPFSVVLFDEVEKADSSFFDLLLSILGEGRLTDSRGRLVDLSSAVIVLTSNLGADSFSAGGGGFGIAPDAGDRARDHFHGALQDAFRPELLGRLDSIVLFQPLGRDIMLSLVDRELELISGRDGALRHGLELEVTPAARERLAELGDDPRFGARPLKRAMEKRLLAPLSAELACLAADARIHVEVVAEGRELAVRATASPALAPSSAPGGSQALERLVALGRSLRLLRGRLDRGDFDGADSAHPRRARLLADRAASLEDELLIASVTGEEVMDEDVRARISTLEEAYRNLGMDLLSTRFDSADVLILALYAEDKSWLAELARAYARLCERQDLIVAGSLVSLAPSRGRGPRVPLIEPVSHLEVALSGDLRHAIGVILEIAGDHARARLFGEGGLHELRSGGNSVMCLVDIGSGSIADYTVPAGVERARHGEGGSRRRIYDADRGVVEGAGDTRTWRWIGRGLDEVLEGTIEDSLVAALAELDLT